MKHFIIPDLQITPDSNTEHLTWAAKYCVEKKPDVIVNIGDHWDMRSLSSYDVGKKSFEGRAYIKDIEAGNDALTTFMAPIYAEQKKQRRAKKVVWKPRLVFTIGNHEERIMRAIEKQRELSGLMTYDHFNLKEHGWEVHDYLAPVFIDGVGYQHFWTSGVMGRPCSSARLMLNKKHMSCVMGHVQDRDIAFARRADGTRMTGIFVGTFCQENQAYLTPDANQCWKGCWMLNEVDDGAFDEMPLSLDYFRRKYG